MPVPLPGSTLPSWAPGVDDVAALIAQRTLTADGSVVGTFTAVTVPTDAQVALLIGQVTGDVLAAVGTIPTSPVDLTADARAVAALGAASLVEASFFADDDNAFERLDQRYREALARLARAAGEVATDGTITPEGVLALPQYSFPAVAAAVGVPASGVRVTTLTDPW
jgi:hypothetical protein